jgi:hypothetical protein
MSKKDMPEGKPSIQKIYETIDRVLQSENIRNIEEETKQIRLRDMKDFTMAALTGFCANPQLSTWPHEDYAYHAVKTAEAALAELEGRDG